MLIRPSLVLQVKLQPEVYSDAVAEEIRRSFIYLAQSLVSQASPEEAAEGNVMRLSIRLMKPYWDTHDPKSCELWDKVMRRWLRNVVRNMSVAMHNYNTVDHPEGCGALHYEWVDFDFGRNALIRVKTDGENRIAQEVPRMIEKIRLLMNDRAFGDKDIAMIRVPSRVSYEMQKQAALELDRKHNTLPDDDPSSGRGSAPETQELTVSEVAQSEASITPFSIDFRTWGIEYADGAIREFDSTEE